VGAPVLSGKKRNTEFASFSLKNVACCSDNEHKKHILINNNNNNNNNNKPICNAPDASVTDPEARRTLRNITVRVDH